MTLRHKDRSASSRQEVRASSRLAVRAPEATTRDAGKVQVGGYIKKLPVSPPDAATRDAGKVQVGGYIKRLPTA